MNRRHFLGWFGGSIGTLAVYKELDAAPSATAASNPAPSPSLPVQGNGRMVIRNEGELPMVVHYHRETPPDRQHWPAKRNDVRDVSSLLLPGEELTITAVPAKIH